MVCLEASASTAVKWSGVKKRRLVMVYSSCMREFVKIGNLSYFSLNNIRKSI